MERAIFSFGDVTFRPSARTLLWQGHPVHLTKKAFRLLEILVERRPKPVPKPELSRLIWPDTIVTEGNLATLAHEVRLALRDDEARFLRTIHGFGYAFIGDVRVETDAQPPKPAVRATFRVVVGTREIELVEGENWIGRSNDCRVQVDCSRASRHHARIVIEKGRAILEDGPSRNGTFLKDKRLTARTPLDIGDEIRVGSTYMTLRFVSPDTPTDAEPDA